MRQTPLFNLHQALGAYMVDFYDWAMPLHYGSQLQEHNTVRERAGMFDVSHMHVVAVSGDNAQDALRSLLANDVAKLSHGQAQYSLMLNDQGGIIDDLIVYAMGDNDYRLVFNAATRSAVLPWLDQQHIPYQSLDHLAIIAVQGPQALPAFSQVLPDQASALAACQPFHFFQTDGVLIARTGYTGEDGVEMIMPTDQAEVLWQQLIEAGVAPCGLGARDTLRLEAGMCLSGTDMDATILPKQAGLGWVVDTKALDRRFVGREAHEMPASESFVGLVLQGKGVMRNGQAVLLNDQSVGVITSGGFSPTMGVSIALARIDKQHKEDTLSVMIRGHCLPVHVIKPPFVRLGKVLVAIN